MGGSAAAVEGEDEEMAAEFARPADQRLSGLGVFLAVAVLRSRCSRSRQVRALCGGTGMVLNQIDRWWTKVEQRHERSGIGSLITPEDIYLHPEMLKAQLASHMAWTSISWAR